MKTRRFNLRSEVPEPTRIHRPESIYTRKGRSKWDWRGEIQEIEDTERVDIHTHTHMSAQQVSGGDDHDDNGQEDG
jgi:hypothetical protein